MNLRPATKEALDKWLGQETWQTSHHLDRERFHRFVDELRHDVNIEEEGVDEEALMNEMRQTLGETGWLGSKDATDERLRDFKSDILTIFDFLASCKASGTL